MNVPQPIPFAVSPSFLTIQDQNPASELFQIIERKFGALCRRIELKRNSLIFCQGTETQYLYLIGTGEVSLTRCSLDGGETLLSVLGPKDFFGECALLSGSPVTFTASATKRSVIVQLPKQRFLFLLEDPLTCRLLLEVVARRCADAWTQMEVIGCTYAREKVRSGLRWLSNRVGVETRRGVRIDLNQAQLARMIGCARETLSREVSELKRMGALDINYDNGRKVFFVRDPDSPVECQ